MSFVWNHFKASLTNYINQYDDLFDENMFINKKNSYINLLKENEEFIESINKILKKNKKIQKKKVIPIKYEEQLEYFCHRKHVLALKNIDDMKYEKNLTYDIDDPYLFIIEHSFSDKECDDMIKQFENEKHLHYKISDRWWLFSHDEENKRDFYIKNRKVGENGIIYVLKTKRIIK